jgi:hypothetical protein
MTVVMVGAGRRRRCSGAFPRFSTYGIKLSRIYGESCSTAIVGLCAPTTPLYLCGAARRGGPLPYMASAPDQGTD